MHSSAEQPASQREGCPHSLSRFKTHKTIGRQSGRKWSHSDGEMIEIKEIGSIDQKMIDVSKIHTKKIILSCRQMGKKVKCFGN